MGYFNYFIKSFIRIFTRKFFWVILVFVLLFVGLLFIDKVNAEDNLTEVNFYYKGRLITVRLNLTEVRNYVFLYNPVKDKIILAKNNENGFYFTFRKVQDSQYGRMDIYRTSDFGFSATTNFWVFNPTTKEFSDYKYGTSDDQIFQATNETNVQLLATNYSEIYYKYIRTDGYGNETGFQVLNTTGPLYIKTGLTWITNYAEMVDLNYDYLSIDGNQLQYFQEVGVGPFTTKVYADLKFTYTYEGESTTFNILPEWVTWSGNNETNVFVINIPKDALHMGVTLRPNTWFEYKVEYSFPFPIPTTSVLDTNGELAYSFTQEEADKQNQSSEDYKRQQEFIAQQQQLEEQRKQTEELQNINDSINNPNVDDSVLGDMPQASTIQDNTGISAIFQQMYNAFCTNQVISFTLDVPFVNESITIDSDYSNNYPVQLRTMASVFWWFVIGLFVLKDVRSIINKIAEGNVENVGSDVQKEVL